MKKTLSILIPTYSSDPRQLVTELLRQARQATALDGYEVVVVDDGSPDPSSVEPLWEMSGWPHCRFMALDENIGRARIRNLLATMALYEWLLYLDCDMTVSDPHFVENYLNADDDYGVVDGGVSIGPGTADNLRWKYETEAAPEHTLEKRRQRPYQHFHTANFMVRQDIMHAYPFDQRFRNYGYEDVLFGKQLKQAGVGILHIDNPAGFCTFESNAHFVEKTEEALRTLHKFRDDLRGYSQLLTFVEGIHLAPVRWLLQLGHRLFGWLMRRNLCGSKPSLTVLKLYKTGYYLNLQTHKLTNLKLLLL